PAGFGSLRPIPISITCEAGAGPSLVALASGRTFRGNHTRAVWACAVAAPIPTVATTVATTNERKRRWGTGPLPSGCRVMRLPFAPRDGEAALHYPKSGQTMHSCAPLARAQVATRRARALRDFGRLVLAGEAVASALDGRDELRQVDLERVEDLVGVVLGAEADLALASAGVLDDVLCGSLGLLGDLLLGDHLLLALTRLLDDPLGLPLGLGEHLLTLLD